MDKPVRGTVSAVRMEKTGKILVNTDMVLEAYSKNWGNIPANFGEARAIELCLACGDALDELKRLRRKARRANAQK